MDKIYKQLLEKGFKSMYCTNFNFTQNSGYNSRLIYRFQTDSKDIIKLIFKTMNIFEKFFLIIDSDNFKLSIDFSEDLKMCYLIADTRYEHKNHKIEINDYEKLLQVIPDQLDFIVYNLKNET